MTVADPGPDRGRDQLGAVYLEFLLVFLPVFLLFLAVIELGFIYTGRLVVQHAATRAARAAVVVIDDDPALYGGEQRGRVDINGTTTTTSPIEVFLTGTGLGEATGPAGSPRFRDIRSAASIPLLAVAPSSAALNEKESVRSAIGIGADRAATGAQRYNEASLAVTFPRAPGESTFRTSFEEDEMITVRVTYLMHCSVPLVPVLMCRDPSDLGLAPEEAQQLDLAYLSTLNSPRYQVLRAETTLRNQGAGYLYPSEGSQ
jgi:hypothetical protein